MKKAAAIVLVTTSYPIGGDGSEAAGDFVSDLADALARHRPVRVVAPGPVAVHEYRSTGVEVFRYPAPSKPLANLKLSSPLDWFSTWRVLLAGKRAVREAVKSGPTAHILALWALPSGYWARVIARESGIKYSVWTLGSDIWKLGRVPVIRVFLRRVLSEADRCYSDGLKLASDTRHIGRCEVSFLPSTRRISKSRSGPLRDEPPYRLLFLGRWHSNKGIDLLLDALGCLKDADWARIESIKICGGGPLGADVKRRVACLMSSGKPVCLEGYLDKPAAEQAFLDADYLLLPSRIESIPVVFSDALKLGCPVLATPVGDLPRLLGGAMPPGMLAAAVSAEAYAQMLSSALKSSPSALSEGVSASAKMFDLNNVVESLLAGVTP